MVDTEVSTGIYSNTDPANTEIIVSIPILPKWELMQFQFQQFRYQGLVKEELFHYCFILL